MKLLDRVRIKQPIILSDLTRVEQGRIGTIVYEYANRPDLVEVEFVGIGGDIVTLQRDILEKL